MSGGELVFRLLAAFRDLVDAMHAELARRGHPDVRPAHGFALQAIAPGPVTGSELAGRLGVTKQAAGKTADLLVGHGYVERTGDPGDARRRLLALTPRGREVLGISAEVLERRRSAWEARVGPEGFAALADGLRALPLDAAGPLAAASWFVPS
ncbi:MarR family transcriptional regulator [Actinomycetospora sp. NBRC 106375]|uniref:MarR family winged helix-turn-helix transcriptional regulator n=1 Tax=Actinomycetospora sp. NBRC 106375 TaxID=3032207 RepID=UPI0024A02F1F|nr:MarR family transcriptional regulator [Actinomycetospora sp. NBRC 106375]GLZ49196.1 MarR family transcriptional regulator [Actinomycetospora sp. NBRC 106375]